VRLGLPCAASQRSSRDGKPLPFVERGGLPVAGADGDPPVGLWCISSNCESLNNRL